MHQCQAVSVHVHNINYCWTEWTPLLDQQWLMYYMMITMSRKVNKKKKKREKGAGALRKDGGDIIVIMKLIKEVADPAVSLICTMSLFHFVLINFFPHGCRH